MSLSLSNFAPARLLAWGLAFALLAATLLYPSDLDSYSKGPHARQERAVASAVDTYLRHVNTLLPIGTALLMRDVKGLGQIAAIAVFGKASVTGAKRALNDVEIAGRRLGQRPNGGDHNMPSGHSALASAGAYVAVRRYSRWFGLIVWPVLGLTMLARFLLEEHTLSATLAGALTGLLVAAIFARPMGGRRPAPGLWMRRLTLTNLYAPGQVRGR